MKLTEWVANNRMQFFLLVSWVALLSVFIMSMVVFPFFYYSFNISEVQKVWRDWQTLNAAILAVAASTTALWYSFHNDYTAQASQLESARTGLLSRLNALNNDLAECPPLLLEVWGQVNSNTKNPLKTKAPKFNESVEARILECIKRAPNRQTSLYLSETLGKLQVQDARLRSLADDFSEDSNMSYNELNVWELFFACAEITARVNRIFPWARNESDLDTKDLSFEEYETAYANIGVKNKQKYQAVYDSLKTFTQRRTLKRYS